MAARGARSSWSGAAFGVFTNLASDDPEAQARIGAFTRGLHVRFDYLGRPLIIPVVANMLRSGWLSVRGSFYALPAQLGVVVLISPIQAIATRTPDER